MNPLWLILGWPALGLVVCGLLWRADRVGEEARTREMDARRQDAVDLRAKALLLSVAAPSRVNMLLAREACLAVALVDVERDEDPQRYKHLADAFNETHGRLLVERQRENARWN